MPFKKILIPPGIDRESTQNSADGSWYEADNVRWRDKYTQSIGGWVRDGSYELEGIGRALQSWTDFSGNTFQCVGTTFKFYCISGTEAIDITPVRISTATFAGSNLSSLTSDASAIEVTYSNHGARINDFVLIENMSGSVDGITAAQLNASTEGYQIYQVVDPDTFRIKIPGATSSQTPAAGTGTLDIYLLANSGSLASVTGSGFGVGAWGGDDYVPDVHPLFSPYVTTTGSGSPNVVIFTSGIGGHNYTPAPSQDMVYPYGLSGTINGFDTAYLNNKWWPAASDGSGNALIDVGYDIAGAGGSGGTSGNFYVYDGTGVGETQGATRAWNEGSSEDVVVNQLRTISIHNFGEDLIFANRGGPLYYYDTSANTLMGAPISGARAVEIDTAGSNFSGSLAAPSIVDGFEISEGHGHVIAWGCNDIGATDQNKMLIRWSDRHNPFVWLPSATTESGGEVLRHGTSIMGAVPTRDETVFFTDSSVYSMRYVGYPEVYGVSLVSNNVTAFSRMSAVAVDNSVYFMGNEQFYVYNGTVQPLPKRLSSYVFDGMNDETKQKVFAGINSAFTEVMWFYPDGNSFEPNRYVSYNYSTGAWGMGSFDMLELPDVGGSNTYNRTQWQDSGIFESPKASYITEYDPTSEPETQKSAIMFHETGTNAQGVNINHFIESGEVDIMEGDRYTFYDKIIPDIEVFDVTEGSSSTVYIDLFGRDLPGMSKNDTSTVDVEFTEGEDGYEPDLNNTSVRGRGRTISMKIRSNAVGFGWRMGEMRVRIRPDGRD